MYGREPDLNNSEPFRLPAYASRHCFTSFSTNDIVGVPRFLDDENIVCGI